MAYVNQLQSVFNLYDRNGDAEITPDEIKAAMMRCLGSEEKAEKEKEVRGIQIDPKHKTPNLIMNLATFINVELRESLNSTLS